jgi:flagellin
MNSNRQLGVTTSAQSKSAEKLSSGYRINRAGDDAAGLKISEKMRSQIRGLNRASDNAQDGISLVQTAEGAMEQQHAILQRARELVVQASNTATLDADSGDYQKIQDELDQLKDEFNSINSTTEYNKKTLLDGNFTDQYLQVGANSAQGINISITSSNWDGVTLVTTGSDANSGFLDDIDDKITAVSTTRSNLGAIQNRLEYRVKVDDNTAENLQSAESLLRDTDMAEEMTRYSKESILQQAATSMLAQANQANQSVLSLLQ